MALWRCQNDQCSTDPAGRLIYDFDVADGQPPVCNKCGADDRLPEQRPMLVKLETIHLHVKDPTGPDIGHGSRYRVACGGSVKSKRASGEASPVNCPACKQTPEYQKAAKDDPNVLPEYNIAADLDHEKGVISLAGK